MTRDRIEGGVNSETSSLAEEFAKDPAVNDPAEANLCSSDEILIKPEFIILPDEILPTVKCRLCHSTDHLCSPIFNLGGGFELSEEHLETIYRISDISITYEKDHASAVCSYCLIKIEEFTSIREAWQVKNNIAPESKVLMTEPATTVPCTKAHELKDASTQTILDEQIDHNATDEPEAAGRVTICESPSNCGPEPVQTTEHSIIIVDDGDSEQASQCEVIDVEEYCERSKAKRKRRQSKVELIEEVMRLVKRQCRSKRNTINRSRR